MNNEKLKKKLENEKLKEELENEILSLDMKMLLNLVSGHAKEAKEARDKMNEKIKKYVSLQ
jgi:hypothetical protein